MPMMTVDKWERVYDPIDNPADETINFDPSEPDDLVALREAGDNRVWTEFDSDTGGYTIKAGYWNGGIACMITEKPWTDPDLWVRIGAIRD